VRVVLLEGRVIDVRVTKGPDAKQRIPIEAARHGLPAETTQETALRTIL
jgi:hypothetical protein